jgi:hypothetical protein
MSYDHVLSYNDEQFRRLTGVKRTTFQKMVEILAEAHAQKKAKGGRPNKLTIPEMLLMTLEYLREYRTYLHIGASYGLSESNAYQAIRWVENTLVKSGVFSLPGKKFFGKSRWISRSFWSMPQRLRSNVRKKAAAVLLGQKEAAHDKNSGGCRPFDSESALHELRLRANA